MQSRAFFLGVLHCLQKFFVFKEISVLNGLGNTGQFLIDNAAGAHIQMAHLRVSHLAVGKSHCQAAGLSADIGALAHELIHHRSLRFAHGIVLAALIQPRIRPRSARLFSSCSAPLGASCRGRANISDKIFLAGRLKNTARVRDSSVRQLFYHESPGR